MTIKTPLENLKVGIISRHAVTNYGSLLQAYALEEKIRELGGAVQTIHYIPSCERGGRIVLSIVHHLKLGFCLLSLAPNYMAELSFF